MITKHEDHQKQKPPFDKLGVVSESLFSFWTSEGHADGAAFDHHTVGAFDGGLSGGVVSILDEAESAAAATFPVCDDASRGDFTELGEDLHECGVVSCPWEGADK